MPRLVKLVALVATLLVAVPAGASASSVREPASVGLGVALPIYQVPSDAFRPPGFSSTAGQAVHASETNRTMLALHARQHPLGVEPRVLLGRSWLIDFFYHGRKTAEVVVTRGGRVQAVWTGALAGAPYARGGFATRFGVWWVLAPFSVLFLLPFLNLRRRLCWRHLDGLALLSFLVSYLLFDHAKLIAAVRTVYPPLLYLPARLLWIGGLRIRRSGGVRPASGPRLGDRSPRLPLALLATGLGALLIARIVLSLVDPTVADVGYASVIGAHQIAAGHPIYLASAGHGDTYGPIAYLAYLPFELLFPWHGAWDYLASAHAASIVFDLVTVAGLVLLGARLRPGRDGWRIGLLLGWAWSACPFTLLALMMHTNDGLIAMLSVLSLLAFSSPAARGALLGLAAAAKFAPAALLGLYAGGERRGLKGALACTAAFAAVVVVSIGAYLPAGGLHQFYDQTVGFQLHRADVFSPWALHPGLAPVKLALEALALALAAAVALFPRRRSVVGACALAGAITIAVQLPAVHWFYYYIVWFMPFVLVAMLVDEPPAPPAPQQASAGRPSRGRELVGAGA